MSDIDKDIWRCKELIGFVGCELREIEAQSIENVIRELEIKDKMIDELAGQLELIIFALRNENYIAVNNRLVDKNLSENKSVKLCIIENARNEVLKDE